MPHTIVPELRDYFEAFRFARVPATMTCRACWRWRRRSLQQENRDAVPLQDAIIDLPVEAIEALNRLGQAYNEALAAARWLNTEAPLQ